MSQWYYAHDGQQKGPVPVSELQRLASDGNFDPEKDLVWKEGMDDWKPAVTIPDLASEFTRSTPVPSAPAPTATPDTPAPVASPAPAPASAAPEPARTAATTAPHSSGPPSQGMAIGALVCGILSLLGCCAPIALIAVVLGHLALSKAKSDPARYAGQGLARGGLITGYLGVVLGVVGAAFLFWASTLTPEKVENLNWLQPEQKQQILEALEEQQRAIEEAQRAQRPE